MITHQGSYSMYVKSQSKQDAIESRIHAAMVRFVDTENIEALAVGCATTPQMLRNKLNPNQPHKLSMSDLVVITQQSGNESLVNSVLLELDLMAVRLPTKAESKSPVMASMNINACAGDISKSLCEVEAEKRLTRRKKDEIVSKAQNAVRELVLLMNDVENRCQGATPFVSMCADAVMNGLPIPGLA